MLARRAVEGRSNDLTLDRALHVGDFLRALVHEHNHEVALRVVLRNRISNVLQNRGLTSLRRGNDERTLPLTNRHDQVDHTRGQDVRFRFQTQALIWVQRCELVEFGALLRILHGHSVNGIHTHQLVVALTVTAVSVGVALAVCTNLTNHRVTGAQATAAHQIVVDKHVGLISPVTGGANKRGVVIHDVHNAGDFLQILRIKVLAIVVVVIATAVVVTVAAVTAASAAPATIAVTIAVVTVVTIIPTTTVITVVTAFAMITMVVVAFAVVAVRAIVVTRRALGVVSLLLLCMLRAITAGAAGSRA